MPSASMAARYNSVAQLLHWLTALAIIALLAIGWIMTDLPSGSAKFSLFQLHKSIGITVLLFTLVRLAWRLTHTAPPLPAGMTALQKKLAGAVHAVFYLLMVGMPLSGWIMVSASPLLFRPAFTASFPGRVCRLRRSLPMRRRSMARWMKRTSCWLI